MNCKGERRCNLKEKRVALAALLLGKATCRPGRLCHGMCRACLYEKFEKANVHVTVVRLLSLSPGPKALRQQQARAGMLEGMVKGPRPGLGS